MTNPDGSTVAYTHDAAHRLTDIADGLGNRIHFTLDAAGGRIGQILYNSSGVAVSGHSAVFDTLLEADDDGFAGSGEPVSVGLPDPSAQAQQHLARQLTQILRNLSDKTCAQENCPPCNPYAAGTIGYIGPHTDHEHWPIGKPHLNLFQVNQNTTTCKCFWNKLKDAAAPPPLQGWIDLNTGFPLLSP